MGQQEMGTSTIVSTIKIKLKRERKKIRTEIWNKRYQILNPVVTHNELDSRILLFFPPMKVTL